MSECLDDNNSKIGNKNIQRINILIHILSHPLHISFITQYNFRGMSKVRGRSLCNVYSKSKGKKQKMRKK